MLEWQRDWAHKETYDAVMDIVKNHYGAYGIGVEYVYTMVHGAPATKFPEYAVPAAVAFTSKTRRAESPPPVLIHLENLKGRLSCLLSSYCNNAKVATNGVPSFVEAIAITAGKIVAAGKDDEILRLRGTQTRVIDGRRRTVIPGLNDSHNASDPGRVSTTTWNLRWDGVPSLGRCIADAERTAARNSPRLSGYG